MIPSISRGNNHYGLVKYNEEKINLNNATYIGYNNLLSINSALDTFRMLSDKNTRVEEPVFHVSLNLVPGESVSDEKFMDIANDYMEQLGYGEQPYTVVRHTDKEYEHIHIISCNIDWNGKKINDSNNFYRSMKIAKNIEKTHNLISVKHDINEDKKEIYKIEVDKIRGNKGLTKNHISYVTKELFKKEKIIDLNQYGKLLSNYGIGFKKINYENKKPEDNEGLVYYLIDKDGTRVSKSITASSIHHKPTLNKLDIIFSKNQELKSTNKYKIKSTIGKLFDSYSLITYKTFENYLLKKGYSVSFEKNKSGIYGVSFFDKKNRITYKGSEIGLSWNKLKLKINESNNVLTGKEYNWVLTNYNYLRKEQLKELFFEYQFLLNNRNVLKENLFNKAGDKLSQNILGPIIENFSFEKINNIEAIKEKEENNFLNTFKKYVKKELEPINMVGKTMLLNSFYIKSSKFENGVKFHHARSKDFILTDNYMEQLKEDRNYKLSNALVQKHFNTNTSIRNAVRDSLIAFKDDNYKKMPMEMFFDKKNSYAKNILKLVDTDTEDENFKNLAAKSYLYRNFKRFSSKVNDIDTLLFYLASRGIKLNKREEKKYYLEHRDNDIKIELDPIDCKKWEKKLSKVDLSEKYNVLSRLINHIEEAHIISLEHIDKENILNPVDEAIIKELGLEYAVNDILGKLEGLPVTSNQKDIFLDNLGKFEEEFESSIKKSKSVWDGYVGGSSSGMSPIMNTNDDTNREYQRNEQELKRKKNKKRKKGQ